MDKQINHDNHDESKTRTHIFNKLSDEGDPWTPSSRRVIVVVVLHFRFNVPPLAKDLDIGIGVKCHLKDRITPTHK